ncbi:galactoside O-acetyltransferase [Pseudomonas fragi]|uniref:acyltransferase n=1 Tax=Pseudomonas fragi TaxID=296 RepID=UPI000BA2A29B|nr:acyltransferase [Pseudomonas fragi]PAA41512.1 galactoside O-acetyltransferase [Pseudomonas fragi]
MRIIQKLSFRLKERAAALVTSKIRKALLATQGFSVGKTNIPKIAITWPHKVQIGDHCHIEEGVFFKHDGVWSEGKSIIIGDCVFLGRFTEFNIRKSIHIGNDSLIASGCKFIDHDHGYSDTTTPMNKQDGQEAEIVIKNDVWLGVNVTILKGVTIESGAIVAAGAVVTKSVPAYEIWGGIPARKIGTRKSPT